MEKKLTYAEKLAIANRFLTRECGLSWECLPDINSLHNAETKEDVITLCKERMYEESFGIFD